MLFYFTCPSTTCLATRKMHLKIYHLGHRGGYRHRFQIDPHDHRTTWTCASSLKPVITIIISSSSITTTKSTSPPLLLPKRELPPNLESPPRRLSYLSPYHRPYHQNVNTTKSGIATTSSTTVIPITLSSSLLSYLRGGPLLSKRLSS